MTGAVHNALNVLLAADPQQKVERVFALDAAWKASHDIGDMEAFLPDDPMRPSRPELVDPAKVPRRRPGSPAGRAALLHAIAHIELNAIDLACDMIARFTYGGSITAHARPDFVSDWISVACDEARHYGMLARRLARIGYGYGDFPAHNGLWEAALATRENVAARLAIAPLVLEARGLDVTPGIIRKLTSMNDSESAAILETIYREEIRHVFIGSRWYHHVAHNELREPESYFKTLVKTYFKGELKPPFNRPARTLAELPESYYAA
ncbi:MAG: ferritin-like domain-containing protein [Hyphomonadaceae bacterium]|nr:ferritin-like domain-containing protein [Hyphomonadaceae bacterium]